MKKKILLPLLLSLLGFFPSQLAAQGKALVQVGREVLCEGATCSTASAVSQAVVSSAVRNAAVGAVVKPSVVAPAVSAPVKIAPVHVSVDLPDVSITAPVAPAVSENLTRINTPRPLEPLPEVEHQLLPQSAGMLTPPPVPPVVSAPAAAAAPESGSGRSALASGEVNPSSSVSSALRPRIDILTARENAENAWINSVRLSQLPEVEKQRLFAYGNKTAFLVEDYDTGVFFSNPSATLPIEQIQSVYDQSKVLPLLPVDEFGTSCFFHRHIIRNGQLLVEGEISKAIMLPDFLQKMGNFMKGRNFRQKAYNVWESEDGILVVRFGDHEMEFLIDVSKFPHVHLEVIEKVDDFVGPIRGEMPFNKQMQVNRSYHIIIDKSSTAAFVNKYPGQSIALLGEEDLKQLLTDLHDARNDVPAGIGPFSSRLYKFYVRGDKRVLPELYNRLYNKRPPETFTPYMEEIVLQDAFGVVLKRSSTVPRLSWVREQVVSAIEKNVPDMSGTEFVNTIKDVIVNGMP